MENNSRVALITGATSGLGRAVARALAERGLHVLVHGRDSERTQAVAGQIQAAGGSVDTYLPISARWSKPVPSPKGSAQTTQRFIC